MMLSTWVARWRGQIDERRSRAGSGRREALRPSAEALEQRLAPAVSGPVAPLPTSHAAVVASRAEAVASGAAWLENVARVVLDTTLSPQFISSTAVQLARGLSPRTAMLRLLRTPAARVALTQQDFQLLLGRTATTADLNDPHSDSLRAGNPRLVLAEIAASRSYYERAGGDATGYRTAIARDLLGGGGLPAALGRLPVRTLAQRRRLIERLEQTPRFDRAWAARLASLALEQGTFPARQLQIAARQLHRPDGFRRALAQFLGTPLSRRDVQRRAIPPVHQPPTSPTPVVPTPATPATPTPVVPPPAAPALTVGPTLSRYFGVNAQGLVPDPVTDPPAYGDSPAPSGSGVPMSSPWDGGVVFPEVPYATIMAGGAVQPYLTLPDSLSTTWSPGLGNGLTFQTWFQAKSPGALLSGILTVDGASAQAPLIYINSMGELAAGLFDGTSLTPNSGQTVFNWDAPVGGGSSQMFQQVGASNPVVSQGSVVDNTWHHLAFVVSGQSEALYLDGLLQGQNQPSSGSYSFTPGLAAGHSASGPGAFTMGGTITPEPNSAPSPQINYPQGFIGTVDEVAAWTTELSQSQAQEAMTTPIAKDADLAAGLLAYFNFDESPSYEAWPDQAPGTNDQATGPTSGTLLMPIATTIPTDPFTDVAPLPGARGWGIGVMLPLSSSMVNVGQESGNASVVRKAALLAGDQLAISIPDETNGQLTVQVESDLGTTGSITLIGGQLQSLRATRTGTYEITLSWAAGTSPSATVTLAQIPGPLNDLVELLTSYERPGSGNEVYTWVYGRSGLAGVDDQVGSNPGDVAAASYWPLWSDTNVFPVPPGTDPSTWAAGLSAAYADLVAHSPSLSNSGYANVINVTFSPGHSIPTDIQDDLEQAYLGAYMTAPPTNGSASTPQDAVYQFFTGADQMRTTLYDVLARSGAGTLPQWITDYLGVITIPDSIPTDIMTDIVDGQADQIGNLTFDLGSVPLTSTQVIESAAASAAANLIGAVVDIAAPLFGPLLSGAGSSIAGALLGQVGASNLTVSVKPITTVILTQEKLSELAANITGAMTEQWTNIQDLVNDVTFIETYLSNYGLLEAFRNINGDQLTLGSVVNSKGETIVPAAQAAGDTLRRISWSTMIPAVFSWQPVPPDGFPPADGRTTDLAIGPPIDLPGTSGAWGITAGDFNGDGTPDMAVTNNGSNAVTLLAGGGDGTFTPTTTYFQGNALGPEGIAAGHFYSGDTGPPDLAVANYNSDNLTILWNGGTGNFTTTNLSLNGPNNQDGPNGPVGITVGHFNPDDQASDLAVASYSSSAVSVLMSNGDGSFAAANNIYLQGNAAGAWAIAAGDFNGKGVDSLAVANRGSSDLTILLNDGTGNLTQQRPALSLNGPDYPTGLTVTDLNGDGKLDLAVVEQSPPTVSLLLGNGDGTFQPASNISMAGYLRPESITAVPSKGSLFPSLAVTYTESSGPGGPDGVALLISSGPGTYFPTVYYGLTNTSGARGIVAADWTRDGQYELAVASDKSGWVNLLSPQSVGNFATFQPGSGDSTPMIALGNMQYLQGGNDVRVGPIDFTNRIMPSTSNPPDYLGYISLPYYPNAAPLDLHSPGYFLSVAPAQLQQSASGYSVQQSGSIITGWTLVDANGNPIAAKTLQDVFGIPMKSTSSTSTIDTGVDLTPIDPGQPFAGLNGGWYFAADPAPGAYATWADAFFNWGQGLPGYSPRNLIPGLDLDTGVISPVTGTVTGSSATFSSIQYTLTYTAETGAPPSMGTPVNLDAVFNLQGIVSDGATFSTGGLDGDGTALSARSLNRFLIFNGVRLDFRLPAYIDSPGSVGATDLPNAVSSSGQTIGLPYGNFSTLTFLGSAVDGNQEGQTFTVTYTDGSTQTFTQSMSDWFTPQSYSGESVAVATPYRDLANGTIQPNTYNVYGYRFNLDGGKTPQSLTLPNNGNVTILAVTLS